MIQDSKWLCEGVGRRKRPICEKIECDVAPGASKELPETVIVLAVGVSSWVGTEDHEKVLRKLESMKE